ILSPIPVSKKNRQRLLRIAMGEATPTFKSKETFTFSPRTSMFITDGISQSRKEAIKRKMKKGGLDVFPGQKKERQHRKSVFSNFNYEHPKHDVWWLSNIRLVLEYRLRMNMLAEKFERLNMIVSGDKGGFV